jgi:hypothetical protein
MQRTTLPSEAIVPGAAGIVFSLVALFKLLAGAVNCYGLGGITFWVVIAAVFLWFAVWPREARGQIICLLLRRRDGVATGVECARDGRVPEPLGDDLGMDAGTQRQGGMRVSEIVQTDAG